MSSCRWKVDALHTFSVQSLIVLSSYDYLKIICRIVELYQRTVHSGSSNNFLFVSSDWKFI